MRLFLGGAADLMDGLRNWRVAYVMGLSDMRRRYARSRLGQFWLTISMAITIGVLGAVWSPLWHLPSADLLPHIAASLIIWTLISGLLNEAAVVLASNGPMFLNQGMSFSTAIYALVFRHALVLAHNLPVLAVVMMFFPMRWGAVTALAVPGLALLLTSLVWMSYLVAIACLRFRDLIQAVQSALTLGFFVTPILWQPAQMPAASHYLLALNPFSPLLSVVREPLLGQAPEASEWMAAGGISIVGFALALPIIGAVRHRIVYWI